METKSSPFFIHPGHKKGFEVADTDGECEWTTFKEELPPIDEMIWIIDKGGGITFGTRREFGLYALWHFKDPTPIAWKKRSISAPGIKLE